MIEIMESKEQEYIDHTLLAPEYIREANNFIIDLINFPKALSTHGGSTNNADTLSSVLHFSNGLFNDNSQHGADDDDDDDDECANNNSSISDQHKSSQDICTPINDTGFLTSPTINKCSSPSGTTLETIEDKCRLRVSQEFSITAKNERSQTDKQCGLIYNKSRKVLPHKKRIPRKLKIANGDGSINLDVPLERQERKLSYVDLFVMSSRMRFRCELCDHGSRTQLEFYAHLKQHYEPSTPDTILAAMKTTLDALGPERIDSSNNDLHAINRKTISDANGLAQVLHDIHFPFENLTQSLQSEQSMPYPIKIDYANSANNQNHLSASSIPLSPASSGTQQSLDAEEFSDAEDMLEGIRDKVFIEDTRDTIDLIAPNTHDLKPNWFNNSCFNGMELKVKPFTDALFNGTFQPLQLVNDTHNTTTSTINDIDDGDDNGDNDVDADDNDDKIVQANIAAVAVTTLDTNVSSTSLKNHDNRNDVNVSLIANNDVLPSSNNEPLTTENKTASSSLMLPLKLTQTQTDNDRSKQKDTKRKRKYCQRKCKANNVNESAEDRKDEKHMIMWSTDSDAGIIIDGEHKKFVCKKCLRIFNSGNAFKYHSRTHSGIRPHKCDVCEKKFYAQGALNAHMRMHTGAKPFKCEHCDRQFRQWGDLKYHTTSLHSTEKAYTCEFCGKSFSRKYSLVVHVRIHTSERNYKCEWCDKSFRTSSYLQNHRKIHTGEKPYQCDICTKKFRVSGDLNRHKRMHERQKLKFNKTVE